MPLREITARRPTNFSWWHRRLPAWCCQADIDVVEVRNGRVVAFLETIEIAKENFKSAGEWIRDDPWLHSLHPKEEYALWDTKKVVLNFLVGTTRVPIYIIYHTPDMSQMHILNFRTKQFLVYSEEDFSAWIQLL